MIITCPSCGTTYQIKPASLGEGGRTVRCSSCGERWFVEPETPVAPPPLQAEPIELAPAGAPIPASAPPAAKRGSLVGWLLVTLVVLVLAALLAGRNEIAAQFPAAVPIYQKLGLPIRLPLGVEFRDLGSQQRQEQGQNLLVVTGAIANVSGQPRTLPPIRVALLDGDRREIGSRLFDPPEPSLAPGAVSRFEVTLEAPPPEAKNFMVSFGELP